MYNVPTNAIEAFILYVNAGDQSVVYNSNTYTTGQTFTGVTGVTSFTYTGSGTQIVNEVEQLQGASVEQRILPIDANPYPQTETFFGGEIEFILNKNELIVNDSQILKGAEVEFTYLSNPFSSITTRRGQINAKVTYTPPTKIVYFGDSWTANNGPYPGLVNAINGIPYTNRAVSGSAVSGLNTIYNDELSLGYTGQFVSFMYGTNDASNVNLAWKNLYKGILQDFIDGGFPKERLMIMIPGKLLQPVDPNWYIYMPAIAAELQINIYDVNQRFLNMGNSNQIDAISLHPNATGQMTIATGYDTFIQR